MFLVICALLVVGFVPPALASDYFPLTDGIERTYRYYAGQEIGTYTTRMDGWAIIDGDSVHVLRFIGGPDNTRVEYWSENDEHDKFLHGVDFPGLTARYDPPRLLFDEPLYLGKHWWSPGESEYGCDLEVSVAETTATGAGVFETLSIFEICLAKTGAAAGAAPRYNELPRCADGVGFVYGNLRNHFDNLQSVAPTAVEPVTWGRLKNVFR